MKPIIGITTNSNQEKIHQMSSVSQEYIQSVIRAGGIPILIPIQQNKEDLMRYIQLIDGLLLSGGVDIAPFIYGEEPIHKMDSIDYKRDYAEEILFQEAYAQNKPILGICRGMQFINISLGGTLYQDIEVQIENSFEHSPKNMPRNQVFHSIDIKENNILYDIFSREKVLVNSFHHQAIKELADDLEAIAYSKDGLIEAIWNSKKKFVLGVQWHPEMLTISYPEFSQIFNGFIWACKQ